MEVNVTIGLAFLAGLVSFISPCVLPLVPAYIGYMSGRMTTTVASASVGSQVAVKMDGTAAMALHPTVAMRFSTFLHGVAFVIGFTLVFVIVGVVFSAFVQNVSAIIARLGGVMIIFFGLHFMGVMPSIFRRVRAIESRAVHYALSIGLAVMGSAILLWGITGTVNIAEPILWELWPWMPIVALILVVTLLTLMFLGGAFTQPGLFLTKLTNTIDQALYADTRRDMGEMAGNRGLAGSLLMGVVFSAGWTPCIGPIYGSILNMSAVYGDVAQAVPFLVAYSLGLGMPFLLAALALDGAQGAVRRLSRHMRTIKVASGALLVFIGVLVASGEMQSLTAELGVRFADFSYRIEQCVTGWGEGTVYFNQLGDCVGGVIEFEQLRDSNLGLGADGDVYLITVA